MSEILNTTDVCYLPSRGELYPSDSPLYKKEFVEFRDMTSVEEDIMSNKILLKKGVAFNKILQNVLIDKNIDVMQMTIPDRRALLLRLRCNSYGPEYKFNVKCPECGLRQDVVVNLSQSLESALEKVKPIEDTLEFFKNFDLNRVSHDQFSFFSIRHNMRIVFRVGNGHDEYEMFKEDEKRKRQNDQETGVVLNSLKRFVVEINGNRDAAFLNDAIKTMSALVNHYFRLIYHEVSCDFDLTHHFVCKDNDCSFETDVEIPITSNFFRPGEHQV